jgi:hypothetical protein
VIDLDRFRQIAAGDRLRGQYQALSADPNSLANLDQDLPNNMQAQLPIYTLDRSWLWCETWCSDESLKDAKTIDLVSYLPLSVRNILPVRVETYNFLPGSATIPKLTSQNWRVPSA